MIETHLDGKDGGDGSLADKLLIFTMTQADNSRRITDITLMPD